MDHPEPELIDLKTVAGLLSVSKRHAARLDSTGRLPRGLHLGRAKRWRRETIVNFVRASEQAGRLLSREEFSEELALDYAGSRQ